MTQWVYGFGGGSADGDASMKNLLGGKGANLAEMSSLGLPVPPGFTITTEACVHYYSNGQTYPDALADQVAAGLKKVEQVVGKTIGDAGVWGVGVAVGRGCGVRALSSSLSRSRPKILPKIEPRMLIAHPH